MGGKEVLIRFGGVFLVLLGAVLVIISGEMVPVQDIGLSDRASEFLLRAGFSSFLIGLLVLFLFSVRTVPEEIFLTFPLSQARQVARTLDGLNLEGSGIFIPPGGRLKEDRVYVPLEGRPLPLPPLGDTTVFNVGTTTSSLGVSLPPPGLELVKKVEETTGRPFSEDDPADGTEALERLGKGTGLYRSIEFRHKGQRMVLVVCHHRLFSVCERIWEEYPENHRQVGCPGCSAAITAAARIAKSPVRIMEVKRKDDKVEYTLERWNRE